MEENSETRSDRLKAMRAVAADASGGLPTSDATPGLLANPMLDRPSEAETTPGGPRFDFYTDPMAAFSSTRNRNPPTPPNFIPPGPPAWLPPSPSPGTRNPASTPPYMQGYQPVNQGMYAPYGGVAPYGSQGGIRRAPYPQAWSEFADPAANHGYHPRGGMTGPSPRHQGTPNYGAARSPSVNHGQGNPTWVGNTHRPNSGYGGHQFPSSGRGQGQWHGGNRSPGFGRGSGSGRGRGFNNHGSTSSGKQDPRQFYDASMMEDPWESLKPTEWKGITGGSSESWMPRPIGSKRPRGSSVPSFRQENSGQSLASYLASSFNEASNGEQNT